jgi:phenylpropionate dioxygenase-like ring-hydroxylating dioxygenase large terminal subunit
MSDERGLRYQDLLDTDSRPVPAILRLEGPAGDLPLEIPVERYCSRKFFELEVEKIWRKSWQVACREEDMPDVGDHLVYDIAGLSFLLVRTGPEEIKAYWNACLHRGRMLREVRGHSKDLRCPFHGWCWSLDGRLKQIPAAWDFPHIDKSKNSLPEVATGRWGGFVFLNPDPGCAPLEEFLGELPSHFQRWPLEDRFKVAHVAKIIRCNWKVAQEAFMEALHVVGTHPQLMASIGDSNSQYDIFSTFARTITPNGTPSPHLAERPSEQLMADNILDLDYGTPPQVIVEEGSTARQTMAKRRRQALKATIGESAEELCDAEMMDSIYYNVFPNFHPWGSYNRIVYRFRPHGDNHLMSIMEVMYLEPRTANTPRRAEPIHWLGADDDWVEAPELGMLARVFNQDVFNLPKVQRGLETTRRTHIQLSHYNESRLRHFHQMLEEALERD